MFNLVFANIQENSLKTLFLVKKKGKMSFFMFKCFLNPINAGKSRGYSFDPRYLFQQ